MTPPNELLALADRLEAATVEQEREMLGEVYVCIHTLISFEVADRFLRAWDAGCYESAAMRLVPEGCTLSLQTHDAGTAAAYVTLSNGELGGMSLGATAALALAAAALRAIVSGEQG